MIDTARSFLFVPGDRPERFDKAIASGASCVILDLEDAVLPEAKLRARAAIGDWLRAGGRAAVRINPDDTEFHAGDRALLSNDNILAVVLPKATRPEQFEGLGPSVLALVETAAGLLNAQAIAAAPGVRRLAFGSVDYMLDTGIEDDGRGLLHARSHLVAASAAAGIPGPVDGVTLALDDAEVIGRDCRAARALGMTGKLCIHPKQVAPVETAFAPTDAEISAARRIVAETERQDSHGAIRVDSKLIDRPVVERAKRLLGQIDGLTIAE